MEKIGIGEKSGDIARRPVLRRSCKADTIYVDNNCSVSNLQDVYVRRRNDGQKKRAGVGLNPALCRGT